MTRSIKFYAARSRTLEERAADPTLGRDCYMHAEIARTPRGPHTDHKNSRGGAA